MPNTPRFLLRPGLAMLWLATLLGCHAPVLTGGAGSSAAPTIPRAETPSSVVLAAGESADLGGGRSLKFLRLQNDSRCPKGAQCVWAGEVTLAFELLSAQGSSGFQLSSGTAKSASASGLDFELIAYGACPTTPKRAAGVECASVGLRSIAVR